MPRSSHPSPHLIRFARVVRLIRFVRAPAKPDSTSNSFTKSEGCKLEATETNPHIHHTIPATNVEPDGLRHRNKASHETE